MFPISQVFRLTGSFLDKCSTIHRKIFGTGVLKVGLILQSDRVIDACVYEVAPHRYKMWYKDEDKESRIWAAEGRNVIIGQC